MTTNPVGTFLQSNYNTMTGTQYPLQIDANFAVAQRVTDNFAPHSAASPNMTVVVDAGSIFSSGATAPTEVAQQTSTTITAPSGSNKRIDRAVVNATTGALSIITGTPTTGTPSAPSITAGYLPVAQLGTASSPLTSSTTAITNAMITDERNFWGSPPAPTNGQVSASPAGSTSMVGSMQGFALTITPSKSGNLLVIASGEVENQNANSTSKMQIRYGTGSAPSNGVALTGTAVGLPVAVTVPNNNVPYGITCNSLITGLAVGTAYWIDLSLATGAGSFVASLINTTISAIEQ